MPPIRRVRNGTYDEIFEAVAGLQNENELRVVLQDNRNRYIHGFTVRGIRKLNEWVKQFFQDYEEPDSYLPNIYNARNILFFRPEQITTRRLRQIFRLNDKNNCVFTAIKDHITKSITEDKTQATNERYNRLLKNVIKQEKLYPNGVPETEMEALANSLKVKIVLKDPIGNEITTYTTDKPHFTVELTNTRENHLELVNHDDTIMVEDLKERLKTLRENKDYYVIINDTDEPRRVKTTQGTLTQYLPENDEINEFVNQFNYSRIDAKKYPQLNQFLSSSRHINSSPLIFSNFTNNTELYDMKKAYTQAKQSKHYEGILTLIHQFREIDHIVKTGIYRFECLEDTPFSRMFGLRKNRSYTLISPLIKFWVNQGIQIKITEGAWGYAEDIDFPANLLDDRKLYKKAIGKFSQADNYPNTKYTLRATESFAQHLREKYELGFWRDDEEVSAYVPNSSILTNHQIVAFIVGYTQLNILETILTLNINNIRAILLDGIYTDEPITSPLFVKKELKQLYPMSIEWYEPDRNHYNFPKPNKTTKLITENTFLSGAGGTGKTHTILTDTGYITPTYIVPTNELGNSKEQEYGVNWETIHRTLGIGCQPIQYIPPVILVDEITMIEKSWIEKLINTFPKSLILLAGDIDKIQHYQCRGGTSNNYMEIFSPKSMPIVDFTTDYRSITPQMKALKLNLRRFMKEIYTNGGLEDTQKIRTFLKDNFPHISLKQALKEANENDIFLYSTNRVKNLITHPNKKSVHSFQGKTIEPPTKIYITIDWFEYAMPYTAISRAKHHAQIIFVNNYNGTKSEV